jgi:hypothetical protein
MGGMGPPPGFPHGEGPEALARYLEGLGVRYLVFTDFEVPTMAYGRAHWEEFLSDTGENKSSYLQAQAPYHLDVIASIQALAKSRRVLRTAGTMTLLDLGTPAAPH